MSTPLILGLVQFLFMTAATVSIAFSGLVGKQLSGSTALATMPYLAMTGTTALLALRLPAINRRWGYQTVFVGGCAIGAAGALLTATAIQLGSFALFCVAAVLLGACQCTGLYYRFAAADSVPPAAKGRALAWVMMGGIPAAFVGPALGAQLLDLLPTAYVGSFLGAALITAAAIPLLLLATFPRISPPIATDIGATPPVAFHSAPNAVTAIALCALSYAAMMSLMLATPLTMTEHQHDASAAASVIQWHLLGMFAPSLFSGKLIDRWQPDAVAICGCALLLAGCVVAVLATGLAALHMALVLVGIGWNFMYMSGTALITQVEDVHLRGRVQAANEFATFLVMTLTAGITGWLYQYLGWQMLVSGTASIMAALAFALSIRHSRRASGPAPL